MCSRFVAARTGSAQLAPPIAAQTPRPSVPAESASIFRPASDVEYIRHHLRVVSRADLPPFPNHAEFGFTQYDQLSPVRIKRLENRVYVGGRQEKRLLFLPAGNQTVVCDCAIQVQPLESIRVTAQ